MLLVVTRPEPDAARTAAALERQGYEVIKAPMLRLAMLAEPKIEQRPGAIAFTSRNAVRAIEAWPSATVWRDLPVFAVGEATAAAALAAGFTDVRSAAGSGTDLATAVAAALGREGLILYPTTEERHETFEAEIRAAGFNVLPVQAYRMIESESLPEELIAKFSTGQVDGVLIYSERTGRVFRRLVTEAGCADACGNVTFYILAPAIADAVRALNPRGIRPAAAPDEEHLMQLIRDPGAGR